jgi:imidazolonepropionase-like amidohydrolase
VPEGYTRIDATGKFVTPGIIDIHSHLGDYPSPGVEAHSDGNEMTNPTTPNVWAEHSVWPQDPGFQPRAGQWRGHFAADPARFGQPDGRTRGGAEKRASPHGAGDEVSGCALFLKMACGENPKRVYGAKGRCP